MTPLARSTRKVGRHRSRTFASCRNRVIEALKHIAAGIPKFAGEGGLRASESEHRLRISHESRKQMISAIIRTGSDTRADLHLPSPAIRAHRRVEPDVTGFYDATTGSVQYVV